MPPTKRSRRASTPSSAASSSSTSPSPPPQKRSRKLSKADTADDGEDDYEAERRRRIAENAALLESLGLGGAHKEEFRAPKPPPKPKAPRPRPSSPASDAEPAPLRRSSRARPVKPEPEVRRSNRAGLRNSQARAASPPSPAARPQHSLRRAPSPPPLVIRASAKRAPLPTRGKSKYGGRAPLRFEAGYERFAPNLTPAEMLAGGIFGGGPFRSHHSSVLRRELDGHADAEEFPDAWFEGVDDEKLWNDGYDAAQNRFGVRAGQTLSEWEEAGWVRSCDPRGWWQWYFRFYLGRRCDDDERQISRWVSGVGHNGRFKKALVRTLLVNGAEWDDESVSPVVRQTLWHWAYELDEASFRAIAPTAR